MAILVLAQHPSVVLWDVYAALAKRLSHKYDVHEMSTQYSSHVVVSRAAWMAISIGVVRSQNQTAF